MPTRPPAAPPLRLRAARASDLERLDDIRRRAFTPIFASFRSLLGPEIYDRAQRPQDEAQGDLLRGALAGEGGFVLHVAEVGDAVVGFVATRLDRDALVGEIGLNAIDPDRAGEGLGTAMYELALAILREGGMKVATVGTGADDSHAPARRAYRKAGFDAVLPTVWMYRVL